ncbi:MAG TPA: AAA family ATPase [Gammaproteobacteria bacterium]|nr:AAA family ATPase [Gammaproteobacteria bacterium]
MYEQYYGIKAMPFSLAPDTEYFYCHHGHQEALDVLLVALQSGEGFVKITGEVGTGKTMLCRELLNRLGDEYYTCYIPNPYLSPASLRSALAEELGLQMPQASDHELLKATTHRLIEINRSGRKVVLLMDEAQAIPDQTLETLRLLSNIETEKSKLLHIVLFGQPELDEKLAKQSNRQLRQRIVYSYGLKPLDIDRVASYLDHRLRVAGYKGEPLFGPEAVKYIHRASGGIPRLVNILGNKALMLAYGKGDVAIRPEHVKIAIADTEGLQPLSGAHWREQWFSYGIGFGALLVLATAYFIVSRAL